jgi:hypothetical protein
MSNIAEGIRKSIRYKKETTAGVLAGPTGAKTVRRVTGAFNLAKEAYNSEEVRVDYQMVDFRHGVRSVEGSLNGELSPGTYSDFLASAVARDFTAITTTSPGSVTVAGTGPTYTISRATGSYITDGIRPGMVIRFTGLTATADNNKNLLVTAVTSATSITVVALQSMGGMTAGTTATGAAFTVPGKVTYAPSTGHTDDSYTIEEFYEDIAQSEAFVGCKVGSANIQLPATGLVTTDFSFMGLDLGRSDTTQYFTNATAQGTSGIFASVNGVLLVDGLPVALVTSLSISLDRGLASEAVVGSNIKPEIFEGKIMVSGEFSTLFSDRVVSDYFVNESEISLVAALTTSNANNSDFMTITLPRIKVNSDTKADSTGAIVASNSFQALKGTGAGNQEVTTILIHDSLAV